MSNVYVVIMAGGIGSRFWPKSRTGNPKQFLDILNTGKTLIQLTYDRFRTIVPEENFYVVTADDYEDLVKEQLPDLVDYQILKEPVRRNTAPCITYACDKIYQRDPNATVIITPADHLILQEDRFLTVVVSFIKLKPLPKSRQLKLPALLLTAAIFYGTQACLFGKPKPF